jgi:hypothetical protein
VVQTPPDIKRLHLREVRHQGRQRRVEVRHQGRQRRVEVRHQGRQRRVEVKHQGRQHRVEVEHQGRQHRVEVLDLLLEAIHPAELRLRVDHLDLHIQLLREAVRQLEVLAQVEVVAHLALQLLVKAAVALEGEEDSFIVY